MGLFLVECTKPDILHLFAFVKKYVLVNIRRQCEVIKELLHFSNA
jgi:hypothetical protein